MQQEIAKAILERSADVIIVYANTASHRNLTPPEWAAYESAMALWQQIGTAFEITIDQQIIAPAVQASDPESSNGEEGTGDSK
jgi:hypothetical protein